MASATPSRTLPKSNFHHSIASATSASSASAAPVYEAAPQANVDLAWDAPTFAHPDHVIPPPNYNGIENLIIVCCHAIFHPDVSSPSFPLSSPYNESNWHLAPFQTSNAETGKPGEHETFLSHIAAGFHVLTIGSWAGKSLLIFSGGATKTSLTPLSEARSYYHAALALALSQGQQGGGSAKKLLDQGRVLLEEHATDSYQNLLFSILLFRQTTSSYPKEIRIITHAFKARRFLDLHSVAIRWPSNHIRVQGIDPVMSREEYEDTLRGEVQFGYGPWREDPLGTAELLHRKRKQRGWEEKETQALGHGLEDAVKNLLCGKAQGVLPWSASLDLKKRISLPD